MKKHLLLLCMLLPSFCSFAYDAKIDGIYYNFNGETASVTYKEQFSSDYSGNVVIPKTVVYGGKTYRVTSIGNSAFYGCTGLTSITIPESVTSIGDAAWFYTGLESIVVSEGNMVYDSRDNCNSIIETASNTLVVGCNGSTIPESVTCIGESAFTGCSGFTSITIPESVTCIGGGAFFGCDRLTSVVIPDGVTCIGENTFASCSSLVSITIPNSVTSIDWYAFTGCWSLTSITIPNSVTYIGSYAFEECTGLTSITIPESVTCIGSSAFYNTAWYDNQPDGLVYAGKVAYKYKGMMPENTEIVLKEGTKGIAGSAFSERGLTSVSIPESVTHIGDGAFFGCSLASVVIPDGVTSIGREAFSECRVLTSITISNSVTKIGGSAFYNTAWYNNQPDGLVYAGKVAYKYKGTMPENTEIVLKEDTKGIGDDAFYNCSGLTSITIPESVTCIGEWAFYGCSRLSSVTIPNNVTNISGGAFRGCYRLTSVSIPESVTSIGWDAFCGCHSLTSVSIPRNTKIIDIAAFQECFNLTDMYCFAEEIPITDHEAFDKADVSHATLHVPAVSLNTYKTIVPWSYFGTIVALTDEEMTAIENIEMSNVKLTMDNGIYDLSGRRIVDNSNSKIQNSKLQRGIYIVNGKKVMIK